MKIETSSVGANHDVLQQMNRVLVLSLLRKNSITTRANLAKETGLKRATITNIINDFIKYGIVKEIGFMEGNKGRRSIGITLNGMEYRVIAIRLARQHFTIGLFDITGERYLRKKVEINFMDGSAHAMKLIKAEISKIMEKTNRVISIGFALPGPYLKSENRIAQMSDFPGWEDVNIVKEIEAEFEIPVYAEHDGNASTLAEWWFGNHCTGDAVLLNIIAGQGNGAGIIENGRLFLGGHGVAGELGHTSIAFDGPKCECGNRGCLDLYCSSILLLRNIKEGLKNYPESILNNCELTKDNVANAVQQGDELAVMEVQKAAAYLSYGIVNAINTYDPDIIVVGDEMSKIGGNILLRTIKNNIQKRVLPSIYKNLEIKLSTLDDPILQGAMTVAVDNAFQHLDFI